jgi:hypothetical protein
MVASAILADVEPVRPARRKQRLLAINLVKSGVSGRRTVFSGRPVLSILRSSATAEDGRSKTAEGGQDAGLYGRRDARRYIFRPALKPSPSPGQWRIPLSGSLVGAIFQFRRLNLLFSFIPVLIHLSASIFYG